MLVALIRKLRIKGRAPLVLLPALFHMSADVQVFIPDLKTSSYPIKKKQKKQLKKTVLIISCVRSEDIP